MADPSMVGFGAYTPDVSDFESGASADIKNVFPRGDGYGPVPDFTAFTSAAAGTIRGYFFGRNSDGSITVFAATSTKLYTLNNTDFSWTDVSLGAGSYSALSSTDQWQFAQFNNLVFATQQNAVLQVFDLSSPMTFANALGSPPQAKYVSVVGRFLVLSGIVNNVYRVQWSGLNNVNAATSWDNLTLQSNYQDLADGGIVRGVAGGEFGVIFQDASIRRMIYAPGSPVIFQIERISDSDGIYAPLSLIRAGDRIFFCSPQGFKRLLPGGYPEPIGKERVDRTFFADVDTGNLQLMIGAADPTANRVYWAYKSLAGQAGLFDKVLCYDWVLDRFVPLIITGEYLATLSRPGITLEALDAIAPTPITITGAASNGGPNLIRLTMASTAALATGEIHAVSTVVGTTEANGNWTITVINATHIDLQGSVFTNAYVSGGIIGGSLDALIPSLDSFSTAALAQLSAVSSAHKLGFFTGSNLEATMETTEEGNGARRLFVRGFRPITDASAAVGSISTRENLQTTSTYTAENAVNGQGFIPARVSTRYARAKLRIPAGSIWTFASGVEPDVVQEGYR